MKNSALKKNIFSSIVLQFITILCGFVLPGLILNTYGSKYNGIVNSVNQFLSCITLLRAGVGGATRVSLYKSLANNNIYKTSEIINATENFMRKIAILFILFLLIFACFYPYLIGDSFDWFFTFSLVIILGISTISQYYFGITYQFLLQADQKQYVYNFLQLFATIVNTLISIILIKLELDIRIVKLVSALSFGIVPVLLYFYVKNNYIIDKNIKFSKDTLKGRWDAFAHQIAAFIHTNTDIMILTIFSNLYNVSIYSIYNMISNGVKQLICTCSNSIEAMIGDSLARKNFTKLSDDILKYEWWINNLSLVFLGCTSCLIVPFVMIYTQGVIDANYFQPLFAYILCFSTFLSCIRLPYQNVVEAAGHFKETKKGAIIEMLLNIIFSIVLVKKVGCVGVAIGTGVAMLYRTIDYGIYASKNILKRDISIFFKSIFLSIFGFVSIILFDYFFISNFVILHSTNYFNWCIFGLILIVCITLFVLVINLIFYRNETLKIFYSIKKRKL